MAVYFCCLLEMCLTVDTRRHSRGVAQKQGTKAEAEQEMCGVQADDFVMCDDCKEKTKDRKALKLHRVPEVLLIMLKRTMYPSTEKDDRHITFPLEAEPSSPMCPAKPVRDSLYRAT